MAEESLVEERVATMASPTSRNTFVKLAKFINPVARCADEISKIPSILSSEYIAHKVLFNGWNLPHKKWKGWVDKLIPEYGHTWKCAGIYNAILTSTYEIRKDRVFISALVEWWCPETNTFFFPWGEVSMTLEDMFILGGFSILGEPVRINNLTGKLGEMEEKLTLEHKKFGKHKARKASQYVWMDHFMDSESDLAHVAFLSFWLSRHVFASRPNGTVVPCVFPIAIRLAQGTPVALAPAALSSLYRDLRVLKQLHLVSPALVPTVWAPFQMMQLWAWERFYEPKGACSTDQARAARWHKFNSNSKLEFVRSLLKSPENFKWRPYSDYWSHQSLYEDNGGPVHDTKIKQDERLSSFAHCLRACELVGVDCIERYLPHRVARQFGFDQDLPDSVPRANVTWEVAWRSYEKPIKWAKFYVPPELYEPDVTLRYLNWWNNSMPTPSVTAGDTLAQERALKKLERAPQDYKIWMNSGPPRFPPKSPVHGVMPIENLEQVRTMEKLERTPQDYKIRMMNSYPPGFPPKPSRLVQSVTPGENLKQVGTFQKPERAPQDHIKCMMNSAPPGFTPISMKKKKKLKEERDEIYSESSILEMGLRKGPIHATEKPIKEASLQQVERVTEREKMRIMGESVGSQLNIEDDEGETRERKMRKPTLDGIINKFKREIADLQAKVSMLKKSKAKNELK